MLKFSKSPMALPADATSVRSLEELVPLANRIVNLSLNYGATFDHVKLVPIGGTKPDYYIAIKPNTDRLSLENLSVTTQDISARRVYYRPITLTPKALSSLKFAEPIQIPTLARAGIKR